MKTCLHATLYLSFLVLLGCQQPADTPADTRPNILIILVDDMGYSDIGSFGSEIPTPNLDALAQGGMRLTRFYNAARCCPSRASLLTGLYPHQAGVGMMVDDWGVDSYRGRLSDQAVTIAEVLQTANYATYQVGKWHVGETPEHWPHKRGFDRHFTFVNGASSYYNLWPYRQGQDSLKMAYNGERWRPGPNFFSTDAFSDSAAAFIQRHDPKQPFFMYLAYTAPHWPLHAFPEDIAKYQGKYQMGWDSLRVLRYERMKQLGILDENVPLSPRFPGVPAWESLTPEEQEQWANKMTLYAAVMDRLDQGIGRVIASLKEKGQLDNTLIVFLSDNGGCHEHGPGRNTPYPTDGEPGSERSFPSYQEPWANVSNTPYRLFKSMLNEGGMATPFIAHFPKVVPAGAINRTTVGHIMDLMATSLDLAGVAYPTDYQQKSIIPTPGKSLLPALKGEEVPGHELLFWEHNRNRAVRQGNWKLVSNYKIPGQAEPQTQWELYDLSKDPSELTDLAAEFPDKVLEMSKLYEDWAQKNGVLSSTQLDSLQAARAKR